MQKITVDLLRLAFSGAVACAVVGAADLRGLHHRGQFANAEIRAPPPIHVQAISVVAPPICWTANHPTGAPATQETRTERGAILQSCASVALTLRRHSEPEREPQRLLALAP
jgi:hypothetical protein